MGHGMNAVLSPIEACVFDAYGTLFDVNSAAAGCRDALGSQADSVSAWWRRKQLEYTWLRSLMGAHADFRRVTDDALAYALERHGIDDAGLHRRLMAVYGELAAYPEVPAMLRDLRGRDFRIAVLSNGSPDMLESAVSAADIASAIDQVLSVEAVGIFKPHRSVYQLAVDRLGLSAGKICFVSANGWDVAGAAHFGFRCVWVNRAKEPPDRLPAGPEIELADLRPLPERIAR